jgi:hypothetical protein
MNKLLLLTTILLASCMTEKQSVKKLAIIQSKYPELIAQNCADKFPIKETIEVRETITHDTLKSTDTLIKDSIINNELIRYVYLPGQTITKTIKKDSVIRLENTAKLFVLEGKLKAANEVIIKQKQLIVIGRWVGFLLMIFIGVIFVFKKLLK